MTKKKLWSKLPKKDKKHLRENKIFTKYQFENQVTFLKNVMKKSPSERILCWDCMDIAKKLGMWED